uniref:Uncharacterized protein n=1 Tax=Globodera rostochiensis TaxID=31243 RepID=A0A914H7G9_GLORO
MSNAQSNSANSPHVQYVPASQAMAPQYIQYIPVPQPNPYHGNRRRSAPYEPQATVGPHRRPPRQFRSPQRTIAAPQPGEPIAPGGEGGPTMREMTGQLLQTARDIKGLLEQLLLLASDPEPTNDEPAAKMAKLAIDPTSKDPLGLNTK